MTTKRPSQTGRPMTSKERLPYPSMSAGLPCTRLPPGRFVSSSRKVSAPTRHVEIACDNPACPQGIPLPAPRAGKSMLVMHLPGDTLGERTRGPHLVRERTQRSQPSTLLTHFVPLALRGRTPTLPTCPYPPCHPPTLRCVWPCFLGAFVPGVPTVLSCVLSAGDPTDSDNGVPMTSKRHLLTNPILRSRVSPSLAYPFRSRLLLKRFPGEPASAHHLVVQAPAIVHPRNVDDPAVRLGQSGLGVGTRAADTQLFHSAADAALPATAFVYTSTWSTAAGCTQPAPLPVAPSPWTASHAGGRTVSPRGRSPGGSPGLGR